MKYIDRFITFIFVLAIIILATVVLLETIGFTSYGVIDGILREYVFVENEVVKLDVMIISAVIILLGLKVTVFSSDLSTKVKKNITINTEHGKIQITQDTIEKIATSVIRRHDQIKDVQAKMTKARRGINMYMMLTIYENTRIKELVTIVQEEVRKQIETTTNVKVYNVDVKVKTILSSNQMTEEGKISADNPEERNIIDKETVEITKEVPDGYRVDENNILYKIEPKEDGNNSKPEEGKIELPEEEKQN